MAPTSMTRQMEIAVIFARDKSKVKKNTYIFIKQKKYVKHHEILFIVIILFFRFMVYNNKIYFITLLLLVKTNCHLSILLILTCILYTQIAIQSVNNLSTFLPITMKKKRKR